MPFGASNKPKSGVRIPHALAACVAFFCLAAQAQDRFGGSLAVTSDYVYRGVSLSRGRAAYQGGVHMRLPANWQVGVWGSTIETANRQRTPIEATAFVARSWSWNNDWSSSVSYTRYAFFGLNTSSSIDYDEVATVLAFRSQLSFAVSWAPNIVRYGASQPYAYPNQSSVSRKSAVAIEASWQQPIWLDWSATAGVGYHDLSDLYGRGYLYWHAGLTGALGPIELDLLHINSDSDARRLYGRQSTGPRWSALARWRF